MIIIAITTIIAIIIANCGGVVIIAISIAIIEPVSVRAQLKGG